LHLERNFYGTLRVSLDPSASQHKLYHGSTLHGRQFIDLARRCEPLSYYHRTGPLGSVFEAFNARPPAPHVAVVGLGTGATAAYARPGQKWTFYELDPAVLQIARDASLFTYLRDCAATPVETVLGDARLGLRNAPEGHYGLIVLDAFSSDAIPVHLLTREALDLYLSKLAEGGMVAFHTSNRSLDLRPLMGGLAKNANLVSLIFDDEKDDSLSGKERSQWVVMARRAEDLSDLVTDGRWQPLGERLRLRVWSDDYSDIVSVFKWVETDKTP